jgi:hypothetical protein
MIRIVVTILVVAVTTPVSAQFVAPGGAIPVVANAPGEFGTIWRSDVSIRNVASEATTVRLLLLPELRNAGPAFDPQFSDEITIPGNGQVTLDNVVTSVFGLRNTKGGLSVFSNDGRPLVLASRTSTGAPQGGSFGLNVYGVLVVNEGWIAGVQHSETGFYRTNVGIFVPVDPLESGDFVFTVTTTGSDGLEVAQASISFGQAGLVQKSLTDLGVSETLLDGSITIRCNDPDALWYGYATVIDNASQDSVYRPAIGRQPAGQ